MIKENKNVIVKVLLWFIGLFIICFIGITDIFALSNYNQIQFFDNNGSSVSYKTTSWVQQTQESTATFGLTANSTGGLLVYMMSSPVVNNHIYSMFVNVGARNYGGATQLSSKNCIGLGNSEWAAANDYIACTLTPRFSASSGSTSEYRNGLFFTFIANKNAGYIAIPFTSTETVYDVPIYSYGLEMEDNGDSTNMTQQEVSNIVDTQTDTLEETIANIESNVSSNILNSQQAIISNQNANNQALIQNDNTNTQNIISNNNTNTDRIIADNKSNFQTCRISDNLLNLVNGSYDSNGITAVINNGVVTLNGTATSNSFITLPVNISVTVDTYTWSANNNTINSNIIFRFEGGIMSGSLNSINRTYTNTFTESQILSNFVIRIASGTTLNNYIVKPQFEKGNTSTSFEHFGEICENKLDEQTKTSKGILGKLGDLLDYFNPFSDQWFVKKLVDLLIDGLEALFVPSQQELNSLIESFKSTMETKLGAIYQVADLLVSVVQSVLTPANSNSCMTFPEIKDPMFDKILINQTEYCFDSLRQDFAFLFTLSDMIISIVCTLAFGNMLYKKYEGFIGGNSSDY